MKKEFKVSCWSGYTINSVKVLAETPRIAAFALLLLKGEDKPKVGETLRVEVGRKPSISFRYTPSKLWGLIPAKFDEYPTETVEYLCFEVILSQEGRERLGEGKSIFVQDYPDLDESEETY